jgi:hypothetical protein
MTTRLTVLFMLTLALAAPARAELWVVGDRLGADGWVRMNAHYWTVDVQGLQSGEFVFEPITGGAGLTAKLGSVISLRASSAFSSDGGIWLEDALARVEWPSGWGVTAGQFLLPLSIDALLLPQDYPLMFNGAMHTGFIKPGGLRDVGVMGTYEHGMWDAAAGVVNGNGAGSWSSENRQRKDLFGRIMVQPWCSGPWFGGRIYRAIEFNGNAWLTWGAEAKYSLGSMQLAGEFQNHISDGKPVNSAYLQGLYDIGRFEPGVRVETVLRQLERPELNATAGVAFRPTASPFKLAVHYSYHAGLEGRWSVGEVLVRLQAEF